MSSSAANSIGNEILLPSGARAVEDAEGITFDYVDGYTFAPRPLRMLGFGLVMLIAGAPLAVYIVAAQVEWGFSSGERVAFHTLFGGFAGIILLTALSQARRIARFRKSRIHRLEEDCLEVEMRTSAGNKVYHLRGQPHMTVLLHVEPGQTWTEMQILVGADSLTPATLPTLHSSLELLPRFLTIKHRTHDWDANGQEVIETLQPLSEAVLRTLRIPVTFTIAGGRQLARQVPELAVESIGMA